MVKSKINRKIILEKIIKEKRKITYQEILNTIFLRYYDFMEKNYNTERGWRNSISRVLCTDPDFLLIKEGKKSYWTFKELPPLKRQKYFTLEELESMMLD